MGGMIPLSDASRRPSHFPVVTTAIIVVNAVVFVMELMGGDAFVKQWSEIPADIVAGQHWITILTAHVHARRLDAHYRQHGVPMGIWPGNRRRHGAAKVLGVLPAQRSGGFAGADCGHAQFHRSQSGRQWRDRGRDGRLSDYLPSVMRYARCSSLAGSAALLLFPRRS